MFKKITKNFLAIVAMIIILYSCNHTSTKDYNNEIAYLKSSNKLLKNIVKNTYSQYVELSGNDIVIVKELVDSCGYIIKELEKNKIDSKKFSEIKEWLIRKCDEDFSVIDYEIVKTEIGRQILVNKILSYELFLLSYFRKSQMMSFFQMDLVKFVPLQDTFAYAKNIQLEIETKYLCDDVRSKIIFQGDTILDNENVFSINYSNPKKGENILIFPFIYKRWGEETQFNNIKVKFYVK
jgi:hypothetical protein